MRHRENGGKRGRQRLDRPWSVKTETEQGKGLTDHRQQKHATRLDACIFSIEIEEDKGLTDHGCMHLDADAFKSRCMLQLSAFSPTHTAHTLPASTHALRKTPNQGVLPLRAHPDCRQIAAR